ncbi:Glycine cleavage system transcription activator [Sulfitobacter noctilucicola]|uniref:DNA-binding transcriptional LysR family regulator n=1 Tax=Sulfitobacter noctilucicola TaxID=1342301 RepID=A0A7W6Q3I2_9RHOB|nr:LysR substrate-binding domain-containing protein [Sulfitobacter noctilucicola]KIN62342.1 Glycine cleavage system transcription activator [Sulfitobacter noctilucicola]MBB4173124.1 DNA-binding transcriptional LysR family regulator [Sulfitobacter noctilucicola]
MVLQLPPLNALRAFEAAGRYESFSRAAEELGVSHSSISRHVRGLEDRLGVQLFRDLPRGLELSQYGAAYLAQVSPALEAIAFATEGLMEVPQGTVWVNSETLFATKWLVPRLGAFKELHPDVEIRLEASRQLADVARYETDLAIRFVGPGGRYDNSSLISDAELHPYASPSLIRTPPSAPRDLLNYPLLRDRTSGTWNLWFELAGGVDPDEVPEFSWRMSSHLEVEAALSGQGVLLISDEVVADEVAAGRLVRLSDVGFREGGYHVLHGEGVLRRKAVRVFHEWLLAETEGWRSGQIR